MISGIILNAKGKCFLCPGKISTCLNFISARAKILFPRKFLFLSIKDKSEDFRIKSSSSRVQMANINSLCDYDVKDQI